MQQKELLFITSSRGKYNEARKVIPYLKQYDMDLDEIQELDSKIVIRHKLEQAKLQLSGNLVVEDTSLALNSFKGLPGPLIKWFITTVGCQGLYRMAKDFDEKSAVVSCTLGLFFNGAVNFFTSSVKGSIVKPAGGGGFGFDPVFMPGGVDKTFGQMSLDEKRIYSMREKAFIKLKTFLDGLDEGFEAGSR